MTNPDRILIVDDEWDMHDLLRIALASFNCEITATDNGRRALELLRTGDYTAAIVDLMLPDLGGLDILRLSRAENVPTEIIMLTAHGSLQSAIEALRLGAYDYVTKPFHTDTIRSAVRKAIDRRHTTAKIMAIYDLSQEIALSRDVDEAVRSVVDTARRALAFDACDLWLISPEQRELYCAAAQGSDHRDAPRLLLDSETGIIATVAREGKPLYVPDTRLDPRYLPMGTVHRSELAVPLKVKNRVAGVLNIESTEVDAFRPEEVPLLSILAAQAAVAIENAQLYQAAQHELEERRQAEAALQQRNRELALLNSAIQTVNSTLDLDRILVLILEVVHRLLDADGCSLWLRDADSGDLVCRQSLGANCACLQDRHLALGQGLVGWIAHHGKSLIVPDARVDPRCAECGTVQIGPEMRSVLAVPLWVQQGVIGVLQVAHKVPDRFQPNDLRLLEPLAAAAATPIVNAMLHQRAQQEIVERRRIEEALRAAKEAAEDASQAKSEFLARVSHEIRTPIHAIIGMTSLTLETELAHDQREALNLAASAAESLLDIVNDILDFSKIEARRIELEEIEFDLRAVLEKAIDTVALRAHRKGLEVVYDLPPDVPTACIGDPARLQQVVVNLLSNAVKFTEQGEVVVEVQGMKDEGGRMNEPFIPHPSSFILRCSVCDTGIGIPEDKQAIVFEAFRQADGSTTRRYGGTGLGLSISKQLVDLMNGRIWAESRVGVGTAFHFVIPLKLQPPGESQPAFTADLAGQAVLVVDDNAAQRHALAQTLSAWSLAVVEAADGTDALNAVERAQADHSALALILVDRRMPGMDGFALAEALLRRGVPPHRIALMLPADNLRADMARCHEMGLPVYLVKPIKQLDLQNAVGAALSGVPPMQAPSPPKPAETAVEGTGWRILLAEDNAAAQLIGKKTLERIGYTILVANDGLEVLRLLEDEHVDLILMDVEMPVMDGLAAIRAVRQKESGTSKHVPILAVTAYAMKEDQDLCLAAGADAYVSKPISPHKLSSELMRFLPSRNGDHATEPVDLGAALEVVGGDTALLRESVRVFLSQDYPRQMDMLREAIAQRDALAVKKAAHGLKGALDTFGGKLARDVALCIERMGRDGRLDDAPRAVDELSAEVDRFSAYFAQLA